MRETAWVEMAVRMEVTEVWLCCYREGCPVGPGFSVSKVFSLTPLLSNNRDKWGLALDGRLKDEDTNLASSTV